MAKTLISDRVSVHRRYIRAVEIERDFDVPDALDGYVLTPTARDGLSRILTGLESESSQRAFRITGPYGSGKSAFGLLVARLLCESDRGGPAHKIIGGEFGKTKIPSYLPVILVGNRSSFSMSLLEAITFSAESVLSGQDNVVKKLKKFKKQCANKVENLKEFLDLVSEVADHIHKQKKKKLLLLIDEMGRFLEFAASNPNREDPSIFQMLAERACGSGKINLAVIVVMHHRFGDYVASKGEWMEEEWSRTSERYEEIAFFESSEQILHLLSKALIPAKKHAVKILAGSKSLFKRAVKDGIFSTKKSDIAEVAQNIYPLHPATVACLISSSLRFGQYERSVFSFLQSSEPSGFQRFATENSYGDANWYLLNDLFDYFTSQAHLQFKSNDRDRRWQLAQDSLLMNSDLPELNVKVHKAIAIISVLEPIPGLKSDSETIAWALNIEENQVDEAIDELLERGIIHKRSTQGDYCLWPQSSIDLNSWLNRAKVSVSSTGMDNEIFEFSPMRPLVAQRHYQQTGSLRTFEITLSAESAQLNQDSDGSILIIAVQPDESYEKCLKSARKLSRQMGYLVLVKLLRISTFHVEIANNLKWWRWIKENCDDLRVDDYALSEVNSRIQNFANLLKDSLVSVVDSSDNSIESAWIHNGKEVSIKSRFDLVGYLSKICDEVYHQSPILRNELINRDKLSAPISAARMRLMGLMLKKENIENLGIEGTPPEFTIYLSMFKSSKMHVGKANRIRISGPPKDDPNNWKPTWEFVESNITGEEPVTFEYLIEELGKPPYGLKSGPALLLIVAFLISHRKTTILMERNTFQPELTSGHFTRLAKAPKYFALKHIPITDNFKVLQSLQKRVSIWKEKPPEAEVVSIVEALYEWWGGLTNFAKTTKEISQRAQAIRNEFEKASEPIDFLFTKLPIVCGSWKSGQIDANGFALTLDEHLLEINEALPAIQSIAMDRMLTAFGSDSPSDLRSQISWDFEKLRLQISGYELRAFIDRAMDQEISDEAWLDRIASLVVGKRIDDWDDKHIDSFAYEIQMFAHKLYRMLYAIKMSKQENSSVTAIHLTDSSGKEGVFFSHSDSQVDKRCLRKIKRLLSGTNQPKELVVELIKDYIEVSDREKVND